MKIIKTDQSVIIPCPDNRSKPFFQREHLSSNEMHKILTRFHAYQKRKYIFFGEKEWHIPDDVIKYLSSEIY